jgi:hypothetical protein
MPLFPLRQRPERVPGSVFLEPTSCADAEGQILWRVVEIHPEAFV